MREAPVVAQAREYKPGDSVPRSAPAPAPYKDRGPALPIGQRCIHCGTTIGVRQIERGDQREVSCRRCADEETNRGTPASPSASAPTREAANKNANDAQPASGPGPEPEPNPEPSPEPEPKPGPKTEPLEPGPDPEPKARFAVTFFENYAAATKRVVCEGLV